MALLCGALRTASFTLASEQILMPGTALRPYRASSELIKQRCPYFTVTTVEAASVSLVSSWPRPGSSGTEYMPFSGI